MSLKKRKEDRLIEYIEHLINSIYCCRGMDPNCKDCHETYSQLIDGLKKIGFAFDYTRARTFKEITV